jgi:hypothetical protein
MNNSTKQITMPTNELDTPRCTTFLASSLDNYIANLNDNLSFLERIQLENEDYDYAELMRQMNVLMLDQRTYEIVRRHRDLFRGVIHDDFLGSLNIFQGCSSCRVRLISVFHAFLL